MINGLNYRDMVQTKFGREALTFVSISQLAYSCFLNKYNTHDLYQIPDKKMYDIIDQSLYGGNCQVFTRYAKIENRSDLLIDLDENNLYGHSQSTPLPYGQPKYCNFEDKKGRAKCEKVFRSFIKTSREQRVLYDPNDRYTHHILHNKT
jgi:hypothetical protein